MTSYRQDGGTSGPAPTRIASHVSSPESGRGVSLPGLLLTLVLLSGLYVVARLLSPEYAAGIQTAFSLSLNAGVVLGLVLLPSHRQLPWFLVLVAVFSVAIRLPEYVPAYAVMISLANLPALWLFRVLALRFAGGGRRLDTARCLVPLLAFGLAAALLSAACAAVLLALAGGVGWLEAAGRPAPGFLFGIRLLAQADGVVTITPLVLLLVRHRPGTWSRATWGEVGAWLAGMVAVAGVVVEVSEAEAATSLLLLVTFAALLFAVLRRGILAAAVLTPVFAVCSAAILLPSYRRPPGPLDLLPSQVAGLVAALLAWAVAVMVAERDAARGRAEADRAAQEALTGLQRALLPSRAPTSGEVRVASRYRAAGSLHRIGGDWYDTTALPAGGTALVVGDVEGHDLQAASVMALVRGAVRSFALEGHSPASVLDRVNAFLISAGTDRLVSMVYVELYPHDTTVTVAVAGHPAPIVVPTHDPARLLDVRSGPILGLDATTRWEEQTVRLPCGGALVLYTDGLVEFPWAARDQQERLLSLATGAGPDGLEALADALIASAPTYDDAAVHAARLPSRQAQVHERTFPAQAISASVARVWLGDLFGIWQESGELAGPGADDELGVAQLLLTELVSNAVRHSDHVVVVRLRLRSGVLRADVEDTSERMPVLRHPDDAVAEGRGLRLVDALASDWGVEVVERGKTVWFELRLPGLGSGLAATATGSPPPGDVPGAP